MEQRGGCSDPHGEEETRTDVGPSRQHKEVKLGVGIFLLLD